MYAMFAFGITDLFFYSLTQAPWQTLVIAFIAEAVITAGVLVWHTLVQRAVPSASSSRCGASTHLAAYALTPLAMAVVGPAADVFGVRPALAVSGIPAATLTAAAYLLPGMRETEGKVLLSGGEATASG